MSTQTYAAHAEESASVTRSMSPARSVKMRLSRLDGGLMATTRTPGITVSGDGRLFIDKRFLGVRIGVRVGAISQEQAEERLRTEMARVQCDMARVTRR